MSKQVTVIIPAYNEQKYLPNCLKALTQQQTKVPYQIIVVDNNSTDNTASIAKKYNVRCIQELQQGNVYAKRAGVEAAKTDIIAVVDADVKVHPTWINNLISSLKKEAVVAATGPCVTVTGPKWFKKHNQLFINILKKYQKRRGYTPVIWGGNIAFHKHAYQKAGGYKPELGFAADQIEFLHDLSQHGKVILDPSMQAIHHPRRFTNPFYFYGKIIAYDYLLKFYAAKYLDLKLGLPENIR